MAHGSQQSQRSEPQWGQEMESICLETEPHCNLPEHTKTSDPDSHAENALFIQDILLMTPAYESPIPRFHKHVQSKTHFKIMFLKIWCF